MIYVMVYEYQSCFDDGGLGHESFWRQSRMDLKSENADSAIAEARKYIKERSGRYACGGSFCDNKGINRLLRVEAIQPEVRKVIATH